jgi:hypothetical protein
MSVVDALLVVHDGTVKLSAGLQSVRAESQGF